MTLDEILTEVSQRCSIDRFNQDNVTNLIKWVNMAQSDIASRWTWPWLHERTTVTTVVDSVGSSTVTVDATNASQTVAGTGTAFAATDVGRYIQFASSNDWYKITARASTTSITITPAYAPATETAMNFTVRTFYYDLPSDCGKVYDVRQTRTPAKLHLVDTRTFDLFRANQSSTDTPRAYHVFQYSNPTSATGQQWALTLDPIPDAAMLVEVRYLIRPLNLAAGTDVSRIPYNYHHVLVDGACYYAYLWSGNPTATGQRAVYEEGITNMRRDNGPTVDAHVVLQAVDEVGRKSRFIPFPDEFGDV